MSDRTSAEPADAAAGRRPHPPGPRPAISDESSVSDVLRAVVDEAEGDSITVGELMDAFGDRAFGFLLILFSLPNCVPMPPGVAGIVGWPVLLFGAQMLLGHERPWLPGFVRRRAFTVEKLRRIVDLAEPRLRKLERMCRPRHTWAFGAVGDKVVGAFAILVSIAVLIPFPGTNFPPSIGLVMVAIAEMENDGALLGLGLAIGTAGLVYTAFVTGAAFELATRAVAAWF